MATSRSVTVTVDTSHLKGQLRAAVEIVEALATSTPIKVGKRPDVGDRTPGQLAPMVRYEKCLVCGTTDGHDPLCAWQRAQAWVAENPRREATDRG